METISVMKIISVMERMDQEKKLVIKKSTLKFRTDNSEVEKTLEKMKPEHLMNFSEVGRGGGGVGSKRG